MSSLYLEKPRKYGRLKKSRFHQDVPNNNNHNFHHLLQILLLQRVKTVRDMNVELVPTRSFSWSPAHQHSYIQCWCEFHAPGSLEVSEKYAQFSHFTRSNISDYATFWQTSWYHSLRLVISTTTVMAARGQMSAFTAYFTNNIYFTPQRLFLYKNQYVALLHRT